MLVEQALDVDFGSCDLRPPGFLHRRCALLVDKTNDPVFRLIAPHVSFAVAPA
jgi:hypothetical protein